MQTATLNNSSNKTRKPKWKQIQMYQDITHAHRIVCVYEQKRGYPNFVIAMNTTQNMFGTQPESKH